MKNWLATFLKRYLKALLLILTFLCAMTVTYVAANHQRLFPDDSTIVIYGRDSCGSTQDMKAFLDALHIPYIYANIDKPLLDEEMWHFLHQIPHMDTNPGYAYFPVVRVNGSIMENPHEDMVLKLYREAQARKVNPAVDLPAKAGQAAQGDAASRDIMRSL